MSTATASQDQPSTFLPGLSGLPPAYQFAAVIVGQLGFGAILAWHLYYTTSTTLPEIHREYRTEIKAMVVEFRQESAEQRRVFEAALERISERRSGGMP